MIAALQHIPGFSSEVVLDDPLDWRGFISPVSVRDKSSAKR